MPLSQSRTDMRDMWTTLSMLDQMRIKPLARSKDLESAVMNLIKRFNSMMKGIRIAKEGNGTFQLTETGLIDKVIKAAGLEDCSIYITPVCTTLVGSDPDRPTFQEDWEYAAIMGMLMYLAANTRPCIAYAVHQAVCHTHAPRESIILCGNKKNRTVPQRGFTSSRIIWTGLIVMCTRTSLDCLLLKMGTIPSLPSHAQGM
jgi:hypothetical protein